MQFSWDENLADNKAAAVKAVSGIMLGTSPEFEIAMYTLAWIYVRENHVAKIPIEIDGRRYYLVSHMFGDGYLGTCYISSM